MAPESSRHLEELPLADGHLSHSFLLLRCLLPPATDGLCSWLVQGGRLSTARCRCCCCGCFWLHQPFAGDVSRRGLGESQSLSPGGWSLLSRQCCFSAFLVGGAVQSRRQPKPSTSRAVQMTVRTSCHFSGPHFRSTFIPWYQHEPGEAPKRVPDRQSGDPYFYDKPYRDILWAEEVRAESTCTLTRSKITKQQEATYYCTYWDLPSLENHQAAHTKLPLCSQGLEISPDSRVLPVRLSTPARIH